ncbi:UNVERIFIED_CONTAM: hypothetical protein O8I53_08320 [Campylobacter lari]
MSLIIKNHLDHNLSTYYQYISSKVFKFSTYFTKKNKEVIDFEFVKFLTYHLKELENNSGSELNFINLSFEKISNIPVSELAKYNHQIFIKTDRKIEKNNRNEKY